jgi:hypothetical protein
MQPDQTPSPDAREVKMRGELRAFLLAVKDGNVHPSLTPNQGVDRVLEIIAAASPSPVDGEREALWMGRWCWDDGSKSKWEPSYDDDKLRWWRSGNIPMEVAEFERVPASSSPPSSGEYGRNYRKAMADIKKLPPSERSAMSNRTRPSGGEGDDGFDWNATSFVCGLRGSPMKPPCHHPSRHPGPCSWETEIAEHVPAPVSPDGEGER